MNKEQMRIAIATHLFPQFPVFVNEWGVPRHQYPNGLSGPVFNYPYDLNSMHDAEMTLIASIPTNSYGKTGLEVYSDNLKRVIEDRQNITSAVTARYMTAIATAEQRSEAFLKTIDKWVEDGKVTP